MKEDYVPEKEFQTILADEIERYYGHKWPALALVGDFHTLVKLAKEKIKNPGFTNFSSRDKCQRALKK